MPDATPALTRVQIDLNVRSRGNKARVGYEDADGPLQPGQAVEVYESETGLTGAGTISETDDDLRLAWIDLDWSKLRPASRVSFTDAVETATEEEIAGPDPWEPAPPATPDDVHVCKPGASLYYCPTAGVSESDCHGGFDICCGRTELHQPLVPCAGVVLKQPHAGHSWEPQPGALRVHCEGTPAPARDEYEQATGHQTTCTAGINDQCGCGTGAGSLRERLHAALRAHGESDTDHGTGSDYGDQASAVLAVVQPLLEAADGRAEQAEAAIRRVRELHQRSDQRRPLDLSLRPIIHCAHCGNDWPCDTVQALDGTDQTNDKETASQTPADSP